MTVDLDADFIEYVERRGRVCPYCGSSQIEVDDLPEFFELHKVTLPVSCRACEAMIYEVYTLSDAYEIKPGRPSHMLARQHRTGDY